eukprot:6189955-Pleurochrysis_carterae.AAC.6
MMCCISTPPRARTEEAHAPCSAHARRNVWIAATPTPDAPATDIACTCSNARMCPARVCLDQPVL